MRSFEKFVEVTQATTSREELRTILAQTLASEGYDNYIMTTVANRRVGSVAWYEFPKGYAETYLAEKWHEVDPVLSQTLSARRPFFWNDAARPAALTTQQRHCLEACRDLGVHSGIAIPLFGPGSRRDVMSISQRHSDTANPQRLAILQAICSQAWYRFLDLGSEWPDIVGTGVVLTPKELEVLKWIKDGKSNIDIAEILKVSVRTIEFHIENMLNKLGAPNRIAMVVMSLQLGIIQL